ncbi:MAG: rod shape-determining protein MreD [Bacteroidia bacterium]|nr:rod shape-determining protein MreD [Bacteroidia bacterium]NND10542.1 rod shape-determining protein MreD [Flavobacteriaceae bacterium]MBT8309983.1 rod shape-determining protein MreD [Bacteroidia bacterium]NNK27575.1 rod shape-determining protein MreD [Flavobacteriaceae bacterium]NNL61673.1 rod shape-determining protein MreD [Flavobacteriaceae bacterium]
MNNSITINGIRFIVLVLLQVVILNKINFLGYINPYLYILFIILYPIKNNRTLFIFLSFLIGLTIDMFSDSGGVHAAASVTIAFIRPAILKSTFGAMYDHQTVKFASADFASNLSYISITAIIHHVILFSLEVFNISKVILILQKSLFSSIFTIILCILTMIIFSNRK